VLRTVTKIAILLFALVIILDSFGYDVTALLAGIGIGGIAIAFAAQETIADVFGGISLFASRPFTIGDYVQAASIEGTVKEIGLRNTRILTPQNMLVTIPNAKIAKENIINFSKAIPRGIDLTLNLTYDTKPEQLKKAIQIVTNIIKEHPDCEKEPIVVFKNFGSSSLDLFVRYFIINPRTPKGTKMPKILQVTNEINFRILEEFNKAGIEFAYPTQTIYLKKSD
jgi:MscS family membrane protein